MTEWKPIETAPKDKIIIMYAKYPTPFSFLGGHSEFYHVKVGLWNRSQDCWFEATDRDIGGMNMMIPTRWMPLPQPPIDEADPMEEVISRLQKAEIDHMEGVINHLHEFYRKIVDRNSELEVENEKLRDSLDGK